LRSAVQKKKRALFLTISFLLALSLGLVRVWVNVERVDLAYELEKLHKDLEENRQLRAKLRVERDNLLSSCNLRSIAEKQGLKEPKADQVRRLGGK